MKIEKLIIAPGMGGYYFDDKAAIKKGAKADGYFITGEPITPGHKKVRNPGRTISIILQLDSGDVAIGSCVAGQYSANVGRDPVLSPEIYIPIIERDVRPLFEGREITTFREVAEWFDTYIINGKQFHTAIRYGVSQALLAAIAIKDKVTMAEVVAKEYGLVVSDKMIPILAQSSDNRYDNADKMIIKSIPVIPQGLFNTVEKVGKDGEKMVEYLKWLVNRVKTFGEPDYFPTIHLDVYGIPGDIFGNDMKKLAQYFARMEKLAAPYTLGFECPVDLNNRQDTMEKMIELMAELNAIDSKVYICADDWCNTLEDCKYFSDHKAADMIQVKTIDLGSIGNSIEAAVYCKSKGIKAFMGGTCNGTDYSTRVTVNAAMASRSDMVYNKPGMGVDEGYMIVHNEMQNILAMLHAKNYWK